MAQTFGTTMDGTQGYVGQPTNNTGMTPTNTQLAAPAPVKPTGGAAVNTSPTPTTYSFMDGSTYDASGKMLNAPTVVSANKATTDLNQKQSDLNTAQNALATQATNVVANNAVNTVNNNTPKPVTAEDINNAVNPSQVNTDLQANQAKADALNQTFQDQIKQLQNGTFPLTPDQLAQVNSLQAQFDQLKAQQKIANANYTGGMTNAGINAGRNRYAPEIDMGIIQNTVSSGIQKIADIDSQAASAIAQMKQGFADNNYKLINAAYTAASAAFADKSKTIQQMADNVRQQTQDAITAHKDALAETAAQQARSDAAIKFAVDNNINKPFYLIGNTAIDTKTGEPVDLATYQRMTGQKVGLPESQTDFSQIQQDIITPAEAKMQQDQSQFEANYNLDVAKFNLEQQKAAAALNGGGAMTPEMQNAINQGATGTQLLDTLDPMSKATLQSLLDYTKNPANLSLRKSAGESMSEREKFLSMAHLIDPTYDETQYGVRSQLRKDFTTGKAALNIKSLNTAIQHLGLLKDAATELKNGSIQGVNMLKNWYEKQTGGNKMTNFNTEQKFVVDELVSVMKGTGATDQEIKSVSSVFHSDMSPEQLDGAMKKAVELLQGRMDALNYQYTSGMGKVKDFNLLSKDSQKILKDKFGVDINQVDPVDNGSQDNQQSSGTYTKEQLQQMYPQASSQEIQDAYNSQGFNSAGNASASNFTGPVLNQVKGIKEYSKPLSYIDPNSIGTKVSPISKISTAFPNGSTGGQCGDYVRKVVTKVGGTYPTLGDSLKSKTAAVAKYGVPLNQAKIGSVIVTKENPTYGHVAYIIGRNSQGWIVTESNYKRSNKISYGRVIPYNSNKLIGIINPKKA